MSDEERIEKARRRQRQLRPSAVVRRNHEKRSGLLSFEINDDCTELRVWNYRKLRPAEEVVLGLIVSGGGKLFDSKAGGLVAVFKIAKPALARQLLKLAAVPEACARCEGHGEIKNPEPPPPPAPPMWAPNDPSVAERYREWAEAAAMRPQYVSIIRCPVCRGSGRAVTLESEG